MKFRPGSDAFPAKLLFGMALVSYVLLSVVMFSPLHRHDSASGNCSLNHFEYCLSDGVAPAAPLAATLYVLTLLAPLLVFAFTVEPRRMSAARAPPSSF